MSSAILQFPARKLTGNDVLGKIHNELERFAVIGWYPDGQPYVAVSASTETEATGTMIDAALELKLILEGDG
jgi:hypothetical protein